MLIDTVVNDDDITLKVKKVIKYIDKHEGLIDKLFLDIFEDLKSQSYNIEKTEGSIIINVKKTDMNTVLTTVNECIDHHTKNNFPEKLYKTTVVFLFRVVQTDEKTIQIIRKK